MGECMNGINVIDSIAETRTPTPIPCVQKNLNYQRALSFDQHKFAGANECLFDPRRECMNVISVIDSIAETRTPTAIPYAHNFFKASKELHTKKFN